MLSVNLSCPNIGGKPPPAFTLEGLVEYLAAVPDWNREMDGILDDIIIVLFEKAMNEAYVLAIGCCQ